MYDTQGRIQDLGLGGGGGGGGRVGMGSRDRLRSPAVQGRALGGGPGGRNPSPLSSGGLRNYRHFFERQF